MKPLKGYGLFMYNLCEKTGLYFSKHLWLYWLLMFTWALPTTVLSLLATLCLIIVGKKPEKFGHAYRFVIGKNWGGVTLGLIFIQDDSRYDSIALHEYGHVHQLILGPFFLLLCGIPSSFRYWYRRFTTKTNLPPYDEIWFERSATDLGNLIEYGEKVYK